MSSNALQRVLLQLFENELAIATQQATPKESLIRFIYVAAIFNTKIHDWKPLTFTKT